MPTSVWIGMIMSCKASTLQHGDCDKTASAAFQYSNASKKSLLALGTASMHQVFAALD